MLLFEVVAGGDLAPIEVGPASCCCINTALLEYLASGPILAKDMGPELTPKPGKCWWENAYHDAALPTGKCGLRWWWCIWCPAAEAG